MSASTIDSTSDQPSLVSLRDRAGLTPADASTYLGVAVATLKLWRMEGRGPAYAKIGRSVLYRPADLDAFITEYLVGGGR